MTINGEYMEKLIDLRSDTVTKPTKEMREVALNAEVGDDVFGDDPSVNKLEEYAANLMGKEAAIFVSSGTQGNLASILAHTCTGDEVLLEEESHIYHYEVGGLSSIGGTIPRPLPSKKGYIDDLGVHIRGENIHYAPTTLLCLENTHNRHGGYAISVENIKHMADIAHDHNIKVHLDGARIFNATTYHKVDIKQYTQSVDSIQFCVSKGLSAPIGSLVAGDEEFINLVRKKRKMLGGGMRQVGIIAAPALIALSKMRDRLEEDHQNANILADGLRQLGIKVFENHTNIVIADVSSIGKKSKDALELLSKKNIFAVSFSDVLVRFTTHRHISKEDITYTLSVIKKSWIEK